MKSTSNKLLKCIMRLFPGRIPRTHHRLYFFTQSLWIDPTYLHVLARFSPLHPKLPSGAGIRESIIHSQTWTDSDMTEISPEESETQEPNFKAAKEKKEKSFWQLNARQNEKSKKTIYGWWRYSLSLGSFLSLPELNDRTRVIGMVADGWEGGEGNSKTYSSQ